MKKERISAEIALLKGDLKELINQRITSNKPSNYIDKTTFQQWAQITGQSQQSLAINLLPVAAAFAEAPLSDFHVGAIAIDSEGHAYFGANFEFIGVSLNHSIHAEQSAIAHAWARGANKLAALAVSHSPCGHCRQFINEVNLSDDFCIYLPNTHAYPLSHYLPNAFGPEDLGINQRILGNTKNITNTIQNTQNTKDIFSMAQWACKQSHAPYSNNQCGIALQYDDGHIVTGFYGENAAFNPSLPALQMALNSRRLQGKNWHNIKRAVMVEQATTVSQKHNAEHLLKTFGFETLEYATDHKKP